MSKVFDPELMKDKGIKEEARRIFREMNLTGEVHVTERTRG
jgi:hypothetical protein